MPKASEHSEATPGYKERRSPTDRRKTGNPVFEARARRVGMLLDRRRANSAIAGLSAGASWTLALRERCAGWWRPRRDTVVDGNAEVGSPN